MIKNRLHAAGSRPSREEPLSTFVNAKVPETFYFSSVTNSVKINQPAVSGFDKAYTEAELEVHLKKMLSR